MILLLAAGLIACGTVSSQASLPATLDAEFTLAPGVRAVLEAEQIEVQFIRVVDDSRCPRDTTCVWAGEVKVELAIRGGSQDPVRYETTEGTEVALDALRVIVVKVQPDAESTRKIAPEEYRVTLKVVRR